MTDPIISRWGWHPRDHPSALGVPARHCERLTPKGLLFSQPDARAHLPSGPTLPSHALSTTNLAHAIQPLTSGLLELIKLSPPSDTWHRPTSLCLDCLLQNSARLACDSVLSSDFFLGDTPTADFHVSPDTLPLTLLHLLPIFCITVVNLFVDSLLSIFPT